jgi:hypothetical protein
MSLTVGITVCNNLNWRITEKLVRIVLVFFPLKKNKQRTLGMIRDRPNGPYVHSRWNRCYPHVSNGDHARVHHVRA